MKIDKTKIPEHIAIIMDGNRRWARKHGFTIAEGHRKGAQTLEKIAEYCAKIGVKTLTLYAFSSENWKNRTKKEIHDLFKLLGHFLKTKIKKLQKNNIGLEILGEIKIFPKTLQRALKSAVNLLKKNERMKLNIALNYGGRPEIVRAVKNIIKKGIKPKQINEELINKNLYTSGQSDPQLLIRTGGELRLSNFLLWQLSYSELYFTDILWPDFIEKDLDKAIYEFQRRKRRFGK